MLDENLTEEQKIKILNDVFKDQASELRFYKIESMITMGEATDFMDGVKKLKEKEDKQSKKIASHSLSQQEIDLIKVFGKNIDNY